MRSLNAAISALVLAVAAYTSGSASSQASSIELNDPNSQAIYACVRRSEFVKTGQLSANDAVALVMCNGGSGAGSSVRLFVNVHSCPGCGTFDLGEVFGGNHVSAFFAGEYAYVTSALHGPMFTSSGRETHDPSACNQCYTRMLVQRLSTQEQVVTNSTGPDFRRTVLVDKGIAIIEVSRTSDYRLDAQRAKFSATVPFNDRLLHSNQFIGPAKQP